MSPGGGNKPEGFDIKEITKGNVPVLLFS